MVHINLREGAKKSFFFFEKKHKLVVTYRTGRKPNKALKMTASQENGHSISSRETDQNIVNDEARTIVFMIILNTTTIQHMNPYLRRMGDSGGTQTLATRRSSLPPLRCRWAKLRRPTMMVMVGDHLPLMEVRWRGAPRLAGGASPI